MALTGKPADNDRSNRLAQLIREGGASRAIELLQAGYSPTEIREKEDAERAEREVLVNTLERKRATIRTQIDVLREYQKMLPEGEKGGVDELINELEGSYAELDPNRYSNLAALRAVVAGSGPAISLGTMQRISSIEGEIVSLKTDIFDNVLEAPHWSAHFKAQVQAFDSHVSEQGLASALRSFDVRWGNIQVAHGYFMGKDEEYRNKHRETEAQGNTSDILSNANMAKLDDNISDLQAIGINPLEDPNYVAAAAKAAQLAREFNARKEDERKNPTPDKLADARLAMEQARLEQIKALQAMVQSELDNLPLGHPGRAALEAQQDELKQRETDATKRIQDADAVRQGIMDNLRSAIERERDRLRAEGKEAEAQRLDAELKRIQSSYDQATQSGNDSQSIVLSEANSLGLKYDGAKNTFDYPDQPEQKNAATAAPAEQSPSTALDDIVGDSSPPPPIEGANASQTPGRGGITL